MKVLFLDIDGVLNHGSGPIVAEKAAMLNQLKDNCKFVISSDWRYMGLENVINQLRSAGFEGDIIDSTSTDFNSRAYQIKEWLDNNPYVTKFAIVDDNSLGVCDNFDYYPFLIKTNHRVGITQESIDQIMGIL